jgi:hypothetical protein
LPPLVIPNNWPAAQFSARSPDVSPISPAGWSDEQEEFEYAQADIHELEWGDQLAEMALLDEEDDDGP